jgi:hypothetical protein
LRRILLTQFFFSIFYLFGLETRAQIYSGRLSIEIKILDSAAWKSFSSNDCMVILDYKEGYFKFSIEAGKVFNKNGEFKNQEFLDYIEGNENSLIEYYGIFAPESNYMFQKPTQNVKGDFNVPTGEFPADVIIRTTTIGNDERRMQLFVEKQLNSPPLRMERQVLIMIDGVVTRLD